MTVSGTRVSSFVTFTNRACLKARVADEELDDDDNSG